MKKSKQIKCWYGLLILGLLLLLVAPVQAATGYEVTDVNFSQTVTADQFVQVLNDLTVSWTAPTSVSPNPISYYLMFSEDETPLTDTAFFDNQTYDFAVEYPTAFRTISKNFFDAYDSNKVRYLHIKTRYPTGTGENTGYAFSDDVVIRTIRIDNVAPGGTMTLDPASGSSKDVNITLSPSETIRYYWLSESSTYSPVDADKVDGSLLSPVWTLKSTATPPVQVPIYAWFQDLAGNLSTTYATTATYNYMAPVTIVYNSSSIETNGTLGFTVDSSTHYNWVITPSATGVAYVQGTTSLTLNDSASLTVEGKAVGTFTVTATPTAGGSALPATGTISVVQSYVLGDVNQDTKITSADALLVLRYAVKLVTLTDAQQAAGNVTHKTSNSSINSADALKILRYVVKLITTFD